MALNDIEIANLLRGDLLDIEDFNDDDDDINEETIIAQRISEMTEFVDNNNSEMNNLEREKCLLNDEVSLIEDLINCNENSTEEIVESSKKTKKYKKSNAPVPDVRFDGFKHWPEHMKDKKRFKLCVQPYSRTKCSKCDVTLCYNASRNCFNSYHEK